MMSLNAELSQTEIDRLLSESGRSMRQGAVDIDGLLSSSDTYLGKQDKTWTDTVAGAAERGVMSLVQALPSLWQQGARRIQEKVRRGQFAAERAAEGDWKDVLGIALMQSYPVGQFAPRKYWPSFMKDDYDSYVKRNPLAMDDENRWTSKIFNAPADYIRNQTSELMERYPWMQAERVENFKDLITNPKKFVASVIESTPLMVASGVSIMTGAAPLAFALMYGAEGEEAYQQALAETGDKDAAMEAFHLYGLSAAAVEMVQLEHYIKMGKSQYKALLNRTAQKINSEVAKKGTKSLTGQWLKTQGLESLEEMTQGTLQELTAAAVYGKKPEGGFTNFIDRRAVEAAVAFGMGMPFGGTAAMVDVTTGYYPRSSERVNEDKKVMESVQEDVGFKEEDYSIPKTLGRRHAAIESLIEKVFGKKVVWFAPQNKESLASDFNGWAHPTDPGIILLNAQSADPLSSVSFHESIHQLRLEDPDGYRQLAELVGEGIRSKSYLAKELQSKFNRVGLDVSDDVIEEEIVAEVIGRLALDDGFLDKVANRSPSVLQKLGRFIKMGLMNIIKNRRNPKVIRSEVESGVKWIDAYINDMTQLTERISNALLRVTQTKGVEKPPENTISPVPAIPVKKEYTTVPSEWRGVRTLLDWGRKGLRAEGDVRVKGRKTFDSKWLGQFERVPTRMSRAFWNAVNSLTDEVWQVKSRKDGNYWLVPKQVVKEVRALLKEEDLKRGEKKPPSPKQNIVYAINSMKYQGMSPEQVGAVVEEMAQADNIPIEELGDEAYAMVYAARGEQPPAAPDNVSQLLPALYKAGKHPEMTEKEYRRLESMVNEALEAEEIKQKTRRPGKREKAKIAQAPTAERVMSELSKYLPGEPARRASELRRKREAGEGMQRPEKLKTPAQRQAGQLAGEKARMEEQRKELVPLTEAFRRFVYEVVAGQQLKKTTQNNRKSAMRSFMQYLNAKGIVDMQDVTPEVIRDYIKGQVNMGRKASTINQKLDQIKAMFNLLKSDGLINITPFEAGTIERLKEGSPVQRIVSRETVKKVVSSIPEKGMGLRDIAIIKVLFDTGMRVSESLKPELISPGAIQKITGKGAKERQVLITEDALTALERYISEVRSKLPNAETSTAVFLNSKGNPMTRKSIYNVIKKHFGKAGVSISPHNLRASFATEMLEKGMNLDVLSALLGHESADTTQKYLKLSMKHKRAAIEKLRPKPSVIKKKRPVHARTVEELAKKHFPGLYKGWIGPNGNIYPVSEAGGVWSHMNELINRNMDIAKAFGDGLVRTYAYMRHEADVELVFEMAAEGINASVISGIKEFAAMMAVTGRNEINITVHTDAREQTASVEFNSKAQAAGAVDRVFETRKTIPVPSITKKERRLYTNKGPTGTVADTTDRVSGRRASSTPVEMTEEEMLKKRLRAQRDAAKDGYRQGLLDSKQKIEELKTKFKDADRFREALRKWIQKALPVPLRGRMLVVLEKTKSEKTYQKAIDRLIKEVERMQHRQELARLKRFIKAFNKRYGYKRKGLYKEGGKYKIYPEFSELFEKIFERIRTKRAPTPEKYEEFEDMLEFARTERRAAEEQARAEGIDPKEADSPYVRFEIDKSIEQLEKELSKINVQDWTAEQIRSLTDAMTTLIAAYEWQRSYIKQRLDRRHDLDKFNIIGEVMSSWKKKKTKGISGVESSDSPSRFGNILRGLFGRFNYNLQTLSQIVSGGQKGILFRRLARDMQVSVDDVKQIMFELQDHFQKLLEENGITWEDLMDWSKMARTRNLSLPSAAEAWIEGALPPSMRPFVSRRNEQRLQVKLDDGATLEMSVMEAVDILMHLRNEFNYRALRDAGIVFRGALTKEGVPRRAHKLTDADLSRIRSAVPEKALKLIGIMDTLIRISQNEINEISRALEGFDLANVAGYWHITRLIKRGVKGKQSQYTYESIESRSNWKQRVGGKRPVVIGDAFNNLVDTLHVGAEYAGMAESMRVARQITKDETITQKVEERGYGEYWQDIITQLDRLQQKNSNMQWFEKLYGGWARNVTRAVFGVNLRVSAQQYASVFLAASELGFKSLRHIRFKPDPVLKRRIEKWSPMLRERFMGAISRELGDTAKIGGVMRFLTGKDQLINTPMFFVRLFDQMAIQDVWRMSEAAVVEEYQKRFPGITHSELLSDAEKPMEQRIYKDFEFQVRVRAEETVRATQPTWDVVDRSIIGSTKNPMTRALTMFHSQREKLVQMLGISNNGMMNELERIRKRDKLDSLAQAAQTIDGAKAIGKMARTYGIVLTNTAIVKAWAVAYGIAILGRDDDIYDWAWAVAADVPGMFYFGDVARDVVVSWGKKARGKRVYQLGAYEQPPYRVLTTSRTASYEMGNLVMMTTGINPVPEHELKKQLTQTLDATWEASNYALGLPFFHLTQIGKSLGERASGDTQYKKYKGYKKYKEYKK